MERQLSEAEKRIVLEIHGRICFVTGHEIPEGDEIHYHHIKAFSNEGPTDIDNIAPVCVNHHRHIGTMSLQQYRDKLELETFFEDGADEKRLDDVLKKKIGKFGQEVNHHINDNGNIIDLVFSDGRGGSYPLFICPATQTKFFYGIIPAVNLRNDNDLQPRPLEIKRIWELCRHLQMNTQLAASVCRLNDGQILLFDGQHKAAAQIWLGRKSVECKIYVNPDARTLKETNLTAHEKLRQMPFYTSTLIRKYGDVFGADWDEYLDLPGTKSEKGFTSFLVSTKGKSKGDAKKEMRMALIRDILNSEDPKAEIFEFISEENRSRKNPLTYNLLQKTFFHDFLVQPPLDVEFESEEDFRKQEKVNLVRLFNIIAEETLINKWNPESNNSTHKRTERIYLSGAVRAWVPILRDAIAQVLRLYESDQKEKVFFREITDEDFDVIRGRVKRLFSHKIWDDPNPEVNANLKINESATTKKFLKDNGLEVSWVLGSET